MNRKHLLWWVFRFLSDHHPDVLLAMLEMRGEFGDGATHTVSQEMKRAWQRYVGSLEDGETNDDARQIDL